MKFLIISMSLVMTSLALAAPCDLSLHEQAAEAVNRQFDEGQMRGEDHAIALQDIRIARYTSVEACMDNDQVDGLAQEDLKGARAQIKSKLADTRRDYKEQIAFQLQNDRVGMATQLMMERDIEVLRVKNLLAKIKKLIKKPRR